MKNSKGFFGHLFRGTDKGGAPGAHEGRVPAGKPSPGAEQLPEIPYQKGDFIGQKYEVYGVLGKGGCGVVYLVYSHETDYVHALKTFRDEYLADAATRERFRREANVWVELERHPYLVRAYFVDKIAGRFYIGMEYIASDEQGLNSLEGYLRRRPPDLAQSLRWAIQFCHGMEYAYSRGIRSHRDIKPANIMISQDTIKITDFGLAGVLGASSVVRGVKVSVQEGRVGLSGQTMEGASFGTPTHMPPEQFSNAAGCDERSDIYSFGIVLYQMAAGGQLPFMASLPRDNSEQEKVRFWQAMHGLHSESPVPGLDSPLFPVIQHCLEKEPGQRYQTFKELRSDLEPLFRRQTGEVVRPPELKELECWEWSNKGGSLFSLGRFDEAIRCYDRALELEPRDPKIWNNKGTSLNSLGRFDEALRCYDRALELDPQYALTWNNKGNSLGSLGRFDESIRCYDRALELDPRYVNAWFNKGNSLHSLGRFDEANHCFDKALELDPRHPDIWFNKGNSLRSLGRFDEALRCCDRALELDPRDVGAWFNKGNSLRSLGRFDDSIRCYDRALELDPRYVGAWFNKGNSLRSLGRFDEAIRCFDKALKLDPQDARAWFNKGNSLRSLGRFDDSIRCYDRALELDPRYVGAWFNKAVTEDKLGRRRDAARSYQQFLALAPAQDAVQIERARQRLRELGKS